MNLSVFLEERGSEWAELERLVGEAGRRPERLGPAGVLHLGRRYRAALADLALARRRWPDDRVVPYLEDLVGRARHLVYDAAPRRGGWGEFVARGYWRRVVERPVFLAAAAALLVLPALAAFGLALAEGDASAADRLRGGGDLGLAVPDQAATAALIFTHNLQVTFLVYGAGMAAGFGTVWLMVVNGLHLGDIVGIAVVGGKGAGLVELVTPHGVLELSCIVVVAAAGLRLGWSMIDPGPRSRRVVVPEEARRSAEILVGTVPFVVVAGFVEGFVTPAGIGVGPAVLVGGALGAAYWVAVLRLGRAPRSTVAWPAPQERSRRGES